MKPKFGKIQLTSALAGTTATTYNSSAVTYSSSSQIYGGAPIVIDPPPKLGRPKI